MQHLSRPTHDTMIIREVTVFPADEWPFKDTIVELNSDVGHLSWDGYAAGDRIEAFVLSLYDNCLVRFDSGQLAVSNTEAICHWDPMWLGVFDGDDEA